VAVGVDELQIDSRIGDGHLVLPWCACTVPLIAHTA
jgi:hypothetical protein